MIGLKDFKFNEKENYHVVEKDSIALFLYLQQNYCKKKIAIFLNDDSDIDNILYSIESFKKYVHVKEFPAFDCSFLSNLSPTNENKYKRPI